MTGTAKKFLLLLHFMCLSHRLHGLCWSVSLLPQANDRMAELIALRSSKASAALLRCGIQSTRSGAYSAKVYTSTSGTCHAITSAHGSTANGLHVTGAATHTDSQEERSIQNLSSSWALSVSKAPGLLQKSLSTMHVQSAETRRASRKTNVTEDSTKSLILPVDTWTTIKEFSGGKTSEPVKTFSSENSKELSISLTTIHTNALSVTDSLNISNSKIVDVASAGIYFTSNHKNPATSSSTVSADTAITQADSNATDASLAVNSAENSLKYSIVARSSDAMSFKSEKESLEAAPKATATDVASSAHHYTDWSNIGENITRSTATTDSTMAVSSFLPTSSIDGNANTSSITDMNFNNNSACRTESTPNVTAATATADSISLSTKSDPGNAARAAEGTTSSTQRPDAARSAATMAGTGNTSSVVLNIVTTTTTTTVATALKSSTVIPSTLATTGVIADATSGTKATASSMSNTATSNVKGSRNVVSSGSTLAAITAASMATTALSSASTAALSTATTTNAPH